MSAGRAPGRKAARLRRGRMPCSLLERRLRLGRFNTLPTPPFSWKVFLFESALTFAGTITVRMRMLYIRFPSKKCFFLKNALTFSGSPTSAPRRGGGALPLSRLLRGGGRRRRPAAAISGGGRRRPALQRAVGRDVWVARVGYVRIRHPAAGGRCLAVNIYIRSLEAVRA